MTDQAGAAAATKPSTMPPGSAPPAVTPRSRGQHALLDVESLIDDLRQARATRDLDELAEARAALTAANNGIAQRRIAAELGRSQTDVHRLLRRARATQVDVTVGPRELILQAAAKRISRGTMLGRLTNLSLGDLPPGEQVDGYVPGDMDDVRRAYREDLLTEDEYTAICAGARAKRWQGTNGG